MADRFAKSVFTPKNPQKYVGSRTIQCRSSWEQSFCHFCDTNQSILKWASEAIKIPYRDPLTGRQTIYVPDFFIQYVDRVGTIHNELIEIKPGNQAIMEQVGRNKARQAQFVKNQAKWAAARAYCKQSGLEFRILTEKDLFAK